MLPGSVGKTNIARSLVNLSLKAFGVRIQEDIEGIDSLDLLYDGYDSYDGYDGYESQSCLLS